MSAGRQTTILRSDELPVCLFLCHNTLLSQRCVGTLKKTILRGLRGRLPDVSEQKDWETRENAFAAFTMGPLLISGVSVMKQSLLVWMTFRWLCPFSRTAP